MPTVSSRKRESSRKEQCSQWKWLLKIPSENRDCRDRSRKNSSDLKCPSKTAADSTAAAGLTSISRTAARHTRTSPSHFLRARVVWHAINRTRKRTTYSPSFILCYARRSRINNHEDTATTVKRLCLSLRQG